MHEVLYTQLLPYITENLEFNGPITITYNYFYKNKNTDLMNFCALASKWLLDSLVTCHLLPNDNVSYVVQEISQVAGQDKENPRIEATISLFERLIE